MEMNPIFNFNLLNMKKDTKSIVMNENILHIEIFQKNKLIILTKFKIYIYNILNNKCVTTYQIKTFENMNQFKKIYIIDKNRFIISYQDYFGYIALIIFKYENDTLIPLKLFNIDKQDNFLYNKNKIIIIKPKSFFVYAYNNIISLQTKFTSLPKEYNSINYFLKDLSLIKILLVYFNINLFLILIF